MQVILFQNVEKLGMQGDVVNVANGYYRNFLGPKGMALEASEGNLKRLELKRNKLRDAAEKQLNEAQTIADKLADVTLTFERKATDNDRLFGSVTDHDVHEALTEQGFQFERRQVELPEPIKMLGSTTVRIRLVGHVEGKITVVVNPEGGEPAPVEVEAEAPVETPAEPAETAVAPEAEADAPAEDDAKA